ncbi:MAG TPA: MFS transporter [Ruminiclostridium sp.]|nr:MFS transporter [Ruminiclostridium sp.]
MRRRLIALLTAGHIVTDINQGALPALLPFLMASHKFSYAAAASLVFAANISSSIIQPLFGYFADKISVPWLLPLGITLAGCGLSLAGLFSNYWLIFIAVAISGIGIAAYHPEGARLTNHASGEKKGAGVSTFTAGGNIGFATGPIITTAALSLLGLKGSLVLLIPSLSVAAIFLLCSKQIAACQDTSAEPAAGVQEELPEDDWNSFFRLTGVVTCRSILFYGLNTFLPLYFINVFHKTEAFGSTALTILLLVGAVGSLIAGRMADKFGYRNIIRAGFSILIPSMIIFICFRNIQMATLMLIPVGFTLFAPFSPIVVLGQKYLPNRMGLASGVTLGLAVSIGGVFAPLLGVVADSHGIKTVLEILTIMPVLATLISFTLPLPKSHKTLPHTGNKILHGSN